MLGVRNACIYWATSRAHTLEMSLPHSRREWGMEELRESRKPCLAADTWPLF